MLVVDLIVAVVFAEVVVVDVVVVEVFVVLLSCCCCFLCCFLLRVYTYHIYVAPSKLWMEPAKLLVPISQWIDVCDGRVSLRVYPGTAVYI